jgi:hypothetical protein
MKLTVIGSDYVTVNEDNMQSDELVGIPRIHLIKLLFSEPTQEKINETIKTFNKTNRFVICDNIKFYNDCLKVTAKKFYVENRVGDGIISFFRKNNKVLLNFSKLAGDEKSFVMSPKILTDILRNVEVVQMGKDEFPVVKNLLESWNGNVILE